MEPFKPLPPDARWVVQTGNGDWFAVPEGDGTAPETLPRGHWNSDDRRTYQRIGKTDVWGVPHHKRIIDLKELERQLYVPGN